MEPQVWGVIVTVGIALIIIILVAYKAMYKKIPPDVALVVSSGKKPRAYFGGTLVNPIRSKVHGISLNTMNLRVERKGEAALITKDSLRVDIVAEFFVRIEKNEEDVLAATASLGEKTTTPESVSELLEGKLVGALRAVAATMELQELHENRQEFQDEVQKACLEDLKQNGFTLETVSITNLDQTSLEELNEDNQFDAVAIRMLQETVLKEKLETEKDRVESEIGIEEEKKRQEIETKRVKVETELKIEQEETRKLAESARLETESALKVQEEEMRKMAESARIESGAKITKNEEEVRAKLSVEQKQMEFEKQKLELEKDLAFSKAEQEQAVKEAEIKKEQAVGEAEIEQKRVLELARIMQEQEVKEAEIAQQETVEKADIERALTIEKTKIEQEQMVEETKVKQEQVVEEAQIDMNIALVEKNREEKEAEATSAIRVAEKEKESAIAETARLEADAQRAKAEEEVLTVEAIEGAERETKIKLIEAEQKAEEEYVAKQKITDAEVYEIKKTAEAELEAAKLNAEATTLLAEAQLEELKAKAEGERLMVEAKNVVDVKLLTQDAVLALIEELPKISGELMKPAEKIESIRILDIGKMGVGAEKSGDGGRGMGKIASAVLSAGAVVPMLRELFNFSDVDAGQLLQKTAEYVPGLNKVIRPSEPKKGAQETAEPDVLEEPVEESPAQDVVEETENV